VKPAIRKRARILRRDSTDAERVIWRELRAHRLNGVGFRRQTPIGPYVVDFVAHHARLVIEIDGGQHFESKQAKKDEKRAAFLEAGGYRVLRFSNLDVMQNRVGVLAVIAGTIDNAPSLSLPRKRGREETAARAEQSSDRER
jgi:very-short-patch-repair endonuclease